MLGRCLQLNWERLILIKVVSVLVGIGGIVAFFAGGECPRSYHVFFLEE